MTRNYLRLITVLVSLLIAMPVVAQGGSAEQQPEQLSPNLSTEALGNCDAFAASSDDVRTSYYMGEGAAFLRTQQFQAALRSYSCVIQTIDSGYVDAYANRAATYYLRRDFERAILDYSSAIQRDSSFVAALSNRGVAYMGLAEYDDALDDFNAALSQNSSFVPALTNRALVNAIAGNFDDAQNDLETIVDNAGLEGVLADLRDPERDPDLPRPTYDRDAARAYALLGLLDENRALADYANYLTLLGSSADSRIQSAAGALQSRFEFELRFDDGSFVLIADVSGQ